ncbi:CcdB family protein [Rhodoferax antarcticus]|uniref:Toxin CcdB n=1 Tax=Rhodoferax antarcticus ANT.BR TaxID=1111071 RepID=A0A1Q8Y9Z2_9BURK|nr:CcdB family protein [Rhodoferax antarcticus]APW46978.1 plasmid maintenance protein CcdB [Rhodoferax antarcticus]MCW2311678.1 toxin CcdB [Rhodoferax antarcticus]OLP04832.1 ccdB-like toxin protein [Rhodoferax antarcticus ANT.BR]
MARFDVYPNPDPQDAELVPYFLDVQNDHIQGFKTRVLVPLWHAGALPSKLNDLNPEFEVEGKSVILDTPALGAVAISSLISPVASLRAQQFVIQNALDTLFGGY